MSLSITKFIFLCLCLFHLGCSHSQKNISIIPLTMLNYVDTSESLGKQIVSKGDYYLVQNYTERRQTQNLLDSFVEKNKTPNLTNYRQYRITFFKESSETNVRNIIEYPRVIDRYSNDNDRIFEYYWSNGKFVERWKIKNGEVVEPKNNIIVTDIPPDTSKK